VDQYQQALESFPALTLIPRQWLHLTTQGIGFIDEISDEELNRLVGAIRGELSRLDAPQVTFHRPEIRLEAVCLRALPPEPLHTVRDAIRAGLQGTFGADGLLELRAPTRGAFWPHVSIAYANADAPAGPVAAALEGVETEPVKVTIDQVSLLTFHRDRQMYEWTHETAIPIGDAGQRARQT
jgi:2'-5' RNA ligase